MNATTSTMNLNEKEISVTFFGGKEYGFCLPYDADYIAIVGVTSRTSVEFVGGLEGFVRNDAKGIFVAREVVRRLNADEVVEANVGDVIAAVRAIV